MKEQASNETAQQSGKEKEPPVVEVNDAVRERLLRQDLSPLKKFTFGVLPLM